VLPPGADACQSQRLVTKAWQGAVEIIQQLTGDPGHSSVLICFYYTARVSPACMQRNLLSKKYIVSQIQINR